MRRRLQRFLPIVLMALAVQILAPIAACWATAVVASDPLQSAEICHNVPSPTSGQDDQSGGQPAHDGACAICCALQAIPSIDTPQQIALAVPSRQTAFVVWASPAPRLSLSRLGSNKQARAPPLPV
ncbi:MAG: DUF2946 domain-containing protein [Gemmatimonas sp.]